MSDSLQPSESQHSRPHCPSPTPGVHPNSCAARWWCHPAISSSVVPFSSCPQFLQAPGSFPVSWLFTHVAKMLELQPQHQSFQWVFRILFFFSFRIDWLIYLQSKGLSRVISSTTVQKHRFCGAKSSWWTLTSIHDCWKNHDFGGNKLQVADIFFFLFPTQN